MRQNCVGERVIMMRHRKPTGVVLVFLIYFEGIVVLALHSSRPASRSMDENRGYLEAMLLPSLYIYARTHIQTLRLYKNRLVRRDYASPFLL